MLRQTIGGGQATDGISGFYVMVHVWPALLSNQYDLPATFWAYIDLPCLQTTNNLTNTRLEFHNGSQATHYIRFWIRIRYFPC